MNPPGAAQGAAGFLFGRARGSRKMRKRSALSSLNAEKLLVFLIWLIGACMHGYT